MRVDEDQKWHPFHLGQPLWNFINACFFEYGIAAYDLELGKHLHKRRRTNPEFRARAKAVGRKIRKQVLKDYVIHPLLSGPSFLTTLAATFTANLARNIWSHSVIMCGHFPEFEKYELEYVTGPLPKQVFSAWRKAFRLSLPNKKPKAKTPDREQELVTA
jgi:fatty acid desaturase